MVKQGATLSQVDKTVKMNVTVPGSLRDLLEKRACQESRTLSNMVTVLLREAMKNKAA
jgi:flagellar hook assembly protein FlgD